MHTVFALLCFVVVIHWLIFPYPSGLLHWHCGNLTIATVPAKQPWWIWINISCGFIMNDCITTTKQSTTKPCAYFLGYTVPVNGFCRLGPLVGLSFHFLKHLRKKKLQWHNGDNLSSLIVKYKSVSEDKKWISCRRHFCVSAVIEWIQNKTKKSYISKNYHNEAKIKWPPFC